MDLELPIYKVFESCEAPLPWQDRQDYKSPPKSDKLAELGTSLKSPVETNFNTCKSPEIAKTVPEIIPHRPVPRFYHTNQTQIRDVSPNKEELCKDEQRSKNKSKMKPVSPVSKQPSAFYSPASSNSIVDNSEEEFAESCKTRTIEHLSLTPRRSPRAPQPCPLTPISTSATRKVLQDSPKKSFTPVSSTFYKLQQNPISPSVIRKILDEKLNRFKRKRSSSLETNRSRSSSSSYRHHPPSKKAKVGVNRGVGHSIKKFVPPKKKSPQTEEKRPKKTDNDLQTYIVVRKSSEMNVDDSPGEKRFFKKKSSPSFTPGSIVDGFTKNSKLKLKYITVDKTPEKLHGLRDIPIFEQDVKTNVADVEFAMARLFDEKTPKAARPTPTRFRSSPRKHLLRMEENLIRPADTPPVRRSPRKLSNYFSTNGDGFRDHQKLDQSVNSSLNSVRGLHDSGRINNCDLNRNSSMPESLETLLKYTGFKRERVVGQFGNEYVIQIVPGDPSHLWKKAHDVLQVVDAELGFPETSKDDVQKNKIFLYVTDKCIVGCLVVEPISTAHPVIETVDGAVACGNEKVAVKAGISRIWTLSSYRRRKVASRLMSCMRTQYQFGSLLKCNQFAFSTPTVDGARFAKSYTKKKDYLVYQRNI